MGIKKYSPTTPSRRNMTVSTFEEIPAGGGRQSRTAIVVTEIPYQVNKAALIEKIAELVRDKKIEELSKIIEGTANMQQRLAQYERMEGTLNRAIMMAQKTSDQIKSNAHRESEIILNDAKMNASRIVNESLLKAERTELEAEMLKRNVTIFKRKLRGLIEAQLEMVDDIEKVEF